MAKKRGLNGSIIKGVPNSTILAIAMILVFFGGFQFLSSGGITRLDVQILDEDDNLLHEDKLQVGGSITPQSVLQGFGTSDNPFLLLSTFPLSTEEKEPVYVMRAVIDNVYDESIKIQKVDVYLNDKLIGEEEFSLPSLPVGNSYIYKQEELDVLSGAEAIRNEVRLEFTITKESGEEFIQVYKYQYAILTPCTNNAQCGFDAPVCDVEDYALFQSPTDSQSYCVKSCLVNPDCEEGQVCRLGRCGY